MGDRVQQRQTRAADSGRGMNLVLMALMPVVLGMLANRGSRGNSPTQANSLPGAGGGLADVLGQNARRRERAMRGFKSSPQAQRFVAVHGDVRNLFAVGRHRLRARHQRLLRPRAFATWNAVVAA